MSVGTAKTIMNINLNEICRFCLRSCKDYVDLSQTNGVKNLSNDLVEKIKYCYVVEIDLSEGTPTKICYECIQVLSFFYTAKKNVFISEQLLRDVVFVKKKLQEEMKNHEEVNMTTPDVTKIIQKEGKIKPAVIQRKSEPDKNSLAVIDVELNYTGKSINTSCIRIPPVVDVETGETVHEIDKNHISLLGRHNSRLEGKEKLKPKTDESSVMRKLPNTNNDINILLNMRDFEDPHEQKKRVRRSSKDMKDEPTRIRTRTATKYLNGISTYIDTKNILSPHVKRSRKI